MTEQIQRGQQWLEQLLALMGLPARVTIESSEIDQGDAAWLKIDEGDLTPEQIQDVLGNGGKTIDAIQYLANTLLNIALEPPMQQALIVELEGYRVKRQAELLALVEEVAQRVRTTGQEEVLKPMSSAERRQVHNFFKEYEDLATESRGSEPNRCLVVRLS